MKILKIKRKLNKEKISKLLSEEKNFLGEIIPCMGKIFGDICKYQRNAPKDSSTHTSEELKKELGNLITSTIGWCDDLIFSPEECISLGLESQKKFEK